MKLLRTPDERFDNIPDYPFAPHYVEVPAGDGQALRIHHVDEGPRDAPVVLCMHGEPSWSFLYRKMVPPLVAAGFRVVCPDLPGFGKSDKPAAREDYSYQAFMDWMTAWLTQVDLQHVTLMCQDWGGLIGLRLAAEHSARFDALVIANTGLPVGKGTPTKGFMAWRKFSQEAPEFPIGGIINGGTVTDLSPEVIAAYDAPFPDDTYKAGARQFPILVPIAEDDPGVAENVAAWEVLSKWDKPVLTAFSDSDPVTSGGFRAFQERIPGAKGQPHTLVEGGGHFLQEDVGEKLAALIIDFRPAN